MCHLVVVIKSKATHDKHLQDQQNIKFIYNVAESSLYKQEATEKGTICHLNLAMGIR